jgi:hypothetical protein
VCLHTKAHKKKPKRAKRFSFLFCSPLMPLRSEGNPQLTISLDQYTFFASGQFTNSSVFFSFLVSRCNIASPSKFKMRAKKDVELLLVEQKIMNRIFIIRGQRLC